MNIQLDKDDIMNLLKTHSIDMPLTKRLETDFLLPPIKKHKNRSVRRKRNQKRNRKAKTKTRTKHR